MSTAVPVSWKTFGRTAAMAALIHAAGWWNVIVLELV